MLSRSFCDKVGFNGIFTALICALKRMVSSLRIEIEKFNNQNFELWKLKMEDLLVDSEQWIIVDSGTKPTTTSQEYWDKLERRERSTI